MIQSATNKRDQYRISQGGVLDKNKHQGFPVTFKVGGWGLVGIITVNTRNNCFDMSSVFRVFHFFRSVLNQTCKILHEA